METRNEMEVEADGTIIVRNETGDVQLCVSTDGQLQIRTWSLGHDEVLLTMDCVESAALREELIRYARADVYHVRAHDTLEAKQWDGTDHSAIFIAAWIQERVGRGKKIQWERIGEGLVIFGGVSAYMLPSDWILRYQNGVFSLRENEHFHAMYEKYDVV